MEGGRGCTFPGPGRSLDICSLYRPSSPSSLRIFTSIVDIRSSVYDVHNTSMRESKSSTIMKGDTRTMRGMGLSAYNSSRWQTGTDRVDCILQTGLGLLASRRPEEAVHRGLVVTLVA